MKYTIVAALLLMLLLYGCKEESFYRPIAGDWLLVQSSDSSGVLKPFTDSWTFSFGTDDTIRTSMVLLGQSTVFRTWYTLQNNILSVDTPSLFSVTMCNNPQYNVLELTPNRLHIKGSCLRSEMIFEK